APQPADREYTIWLGGARVGTATESEVWSERGVALRRSERMRFLRGRTEIELATVIDIDADSQLAARSVTWTESSGRETRGARAGAGASRIRRARRSPPRRRRPSSCR